MILQLMDWEHNKRDFDIGDLEDIVDMTVSVVSGDEVLTVIRMDGSKDRYDSGTNRIIPYYDGEYTIYHAFSDLNILDEWAKRKSPYDYFLGDDET